MNGRQKFMLISFPTEPSFVSYFTSHYFLRPHIFSIKIRRAKTKYEIGFFIYDNFFSFYDFEVFAES